MSNEIFKQADNYAARQWETNASMNEKALFYPATCKRCFKEIDVPVTNEEDFDTLDNLNRFSEPIDVLFPYMSAAHRELFLSGLCDECWHTLFNESEEP